MNYNLLSKLKAKMCMEFINDYMIYPKTPPANQTYIYDRLSKLITNRHYPFLHSQNLHIPHCTLQIVEIDTHVLNEFVHQFDGNVIYKVSIDGNLHFGSEHSISLIIRENFSILYQAILKVLSDTQTTIEDYEILLFEILDINKIYKITQHIQSLVYFGIELSLDRLIEDLKDTISKPSSSKTIYHDINSIKDTTHENNDGEKENELLKDYAYLDEKKLTKYLFTGWYVHEIAYKDLDIDKNSQD